MQIDLVIACPEGYEPNPEVLDRAREAEKGNIIILRDPRRQQQGRMLYILMSGSAWDKSKKLKKEREVQGLSGK